MNNLILSSTNIKTMNTIEIAEITDKQHIDIKLSAEDLSSKGILSESLNSEDDGYSLNKRDSIVLVAQNYPKLTAKIVDRWIELEEAEKERRSSAPQLEDLTAKIAQLEHKNSSLEIDIESLSLEAKGMKARLKPKGLTKKKERELILNQLKTKHSKSGYRDIIANRDGTFSVVAQVGLRSIDGFISKSLDAAIKKRVDMEMMIRDLADIDVIVSGVKRR